MTPSFVCDEVFSCYFVENWLVIFIFAKIIFVSSQPDTNWQNQLELSGGIDLTGKCQHGFKKNKGTATAGLQLQSLISKAIWALDNDENNNDNLIYWTEMMCGIFRL